MFLLYNILLTIFSPLWVPWMLWRTAKRKEKPNWAERQGNFDLKPRKDRQRVWIHAVSVGEVMAALPILREVKARLPEHEIVLSVTTSSGHQTARDKTEGLVDHLVYFPLDVARFQLAAMQRVQPSVVAIMETELWMNFLWAAKVFGAHTLLLNGRISDRSFPRSSKLKFFYRVLLAQVDRCLMQTPKDAERILALGAKSAEIFGNCKYDQAAEQDGGERDWRAELGLIADRPVLVIGSTRSSEEEDFVLEALRLFGLDRLAIVHAPRHLERAEALAAKVPGSWRRSQGTPPAPVSYVVLDSYGELGSVYAIADMVLIGGSFVDHGGQNLLQPLAHGKPVLHGCYMQNFRDVAEAARLAGATNEADTPVELAAQIEFLLSHPAERAAMGEAARKLVEANLGASARYAEAVAEAAREPLSRKGR